MNVLFVTHYPGFGGANQSGLHLANLLRARHDVNPYFVMPFAGEFGDKCAQFNIPCFKIRYASWRGPRTGIWGFLFAIVTTIVNLAALPKGMLLVWRKKIDLIHANSSLAFYGWLLAKVCRKPIVWHLREFGEADYPMPLYYGKKLSGRIISSANAVIAISKEIAQYYSGFMTGDGNLVTIYNGVDIAYADERMKCACGDSDKLQGFKLCTIGGINDSKNQVAVVRAMAHVKEAVVQQDVHYYLIGGFSKGYKDEFNTVVESLGMQKWVHVMGFYDNVWPMASKMDVGIVPSKYEAFGRVAVELMLCRMPVIASGTGGLPEIVEDNVCGFLFDPLNVEDLANKIVALCSNHDKVREMGEQARKHALTHFSAETNADNVYKIYESCLRKGGA